MLRLQINDDSADWLEFIDEHWEKSPVLMDAASGHAGLVLETLFTAVTNMSSRGPSDRFWIARGDEPRSSADFVMLDLDLMGPQPSDGDFDGFFNRMSTHSFGINVHRLGEASPEFRDLVGAVAKPLRDAPGPKAKIWQSDTFFGNYRATPFGIHRDPASVFSFCLHGRRTYYTWPMEAFDADDPDLHKVDPEVLDRHLPSAERFDVSAGQVFYWPSNRWHLVASDGDPFVVAQVSAYFNPADVGQG